MPCRELDTSVGVPGPHDFAVRISAIRQSASASIASRPASVTIAKRPSLRDGIIRFYCCFYQTVKGNFGKSEIGATSKTCIALTRTRTTGWYEELPWREPEEAFSSVVL